MADITIPQLNAATSVSGTDVMVISQAGVTKKVEVDKLTEKGLSSSVNILHMNPTTVQTLANIGELAFNPDTQTLEVKCNADVTLSIGQENYIRGKNAESSTIVNGTVVYVSGGQGANSLIKRAGNADGTAERVIGVATQDIGANNIGFITTSGIVNKLNTSSYAEGDLLWLGTNGAMTNVKPDTTVDQICIGVVLRAHATEGSILVAVKDDWRDKLAEVRSDLSELGYPIGSIFKYSSSDSSIGTIPFFAKAGDSIKIVVNGSIEWSRLIITYNGIYSGSENRLLDSDINEIVKGEEYIVTISKDIESVGLGYITKTFNGDITISFSVVNNTIKQLSDSIKNTNNSFNSFIEGNSVYESDNSSLGVIPFFGKAGDIIKITVDGTVEWEQLIVTYNGIYTGGNNQLLNSNTKEIIKGEEYTLTLSKDINSVGLGYINKSLEGNIAIRFVNEGSVQSIKKKLSNQIITETYSYYSSTAEKGMLECDIKKGDYISILITGTVEWEQIIITHDAIYTGGNNQVVNSSVYSNVYKNQRIEIFAAKDMKSIGLGYISKINDGDIGIEFRVCRIDVNNIYSGKIFTFLGSSITEGGVWCQYVSDFLHAIYFNCGVGGSRITNAGDASMCRMERLNGTYTTIVDPNNPNATPSPAKAVPFVTEFLFIEGGVNDWAWNKELGNRAIQYDGNGIVADTDKFYDACHQMFVNISNYIPNAKVITVGDVFGKLANRGYFLNEYGIVNDKVLQLTDYADILVDVSGMHGHEAFNMGREAGVNDRNVLLMGDGLHPNNYHASTLARIIIEHLLGTRM